MKHGWEYKKLGELVQVLNGYAFKSSLYENQGIRVLRITNVQKGNIVDDDPKYYPLSLTDEIRNYLLKESDLLMSLTGNVGRVGLLTKEMLPAALNQRVACLRILSNGLNLGFLFHYLNSDKFEQDAVLSAKGIAQKNMSTEWLKDYKLPLPPISVQQTIVTELDKINELIRIKKEQLSDYDKLAQSVFYEMFGDPIDNEKGWEVKKLGELGELGRGVSKHRPRNAPELLGGTMPLIQTGDVANADFVIRTYNSTYSELGVAQSKIWEKGTLCITIAATIGKCAIMGFDACFPDSVVGFTPSENVNTIYMYYIFSNMQRMLEEFAPGVAQKNINLKILNDLSIPVPSLELQKQFAERIEVIEKQKTNVKAAIEKLETLLASRMQYWFE